LSRGFSRNKVHIRYQSKRTSRRGVWPTTLIKWTADANRSLESVFHPGESARQVRSETSDALDQPEGGDAADTVGWHLPEPNWPFSA
jgi:hypothetical protein